MIRIDPIVRMLSVLAILVPVGELTREALVFGRWKGIQLNVPARYSQPVNERLGITVASSTMEARSMGDETSKPDFSDVQGGVKSTAAHAPPKADFSDVQSQVASTADETTIYTVVAGDNLSKIARHFYGDANAWKRIFEANRDQLSDPDRIKPGQMLKIPAKS